MATTTSVFAVAIFIFFMAHGLVQAQWLTRAPVRGTTQIIRLEQIGDSFGDFFALCHPSSAPTQRHLCRVMQVTCCHEGNSSFTMDTIISDPISNFAITDGFHLTGGLAVPALTTGRLSSSWSMWPGSSADVVGANTVTRYSLHYGTVVASAIELVKENYTIIPVQYHLAYDLDRANDRIQWAVHRFVKGRSENDTTWQVTFNTDCAATVDLALVQTTIRTHNGAKVLSIVFGGASRCSGLYQFNLPSTLASNDFSSRGVSRLFSSSSATFHGDDLFYTDANSRLCRIHLADQQQQCGDSFSWFDRVLQIAVSEDKVYLAYSQRYIEVYGFDLKSQERYLPLNVTPDALIVRNSFIFMAYREVHNGQLTQMILATPVDRVLTLQELHTWTPEVPYFHPFYIVGLSVALAVVGALAIVGWVLFGVLRKKTQAYVKSDSYVMLNEKLNK